MKKYARSRFLLKVYLLSIALLCFLTPTVTVFSQFPGMGESEKKAVKETKAEAKDEASMQGVQPFAQSPAIPSVGQNQSQSIDSSERENRGLDILGKIQSFYQKYMGRDSVYRPLILTILTLIVLLQLRKYLSRMIRLHVEKEAFHPENARSFMKVWNAIWSFAIAILCIMAMSGSFRMLGLTASFLGMMLGWSLQQPVTGLAAWLMVVMKKPFRLGDRVIIAGITGDVTDITLTHIILNQVGGSVGGEERSGRGILIPNAILFQHIIINFTLDEKYVLSEIPVRLNFDTDWEKAKEIMIATATSVTKEIFDDTGKEPMVRFEFLDWGIMARLRFQCLAADRERAGSAIIEILLKEFRKEFPRIRFAIPNSQVHYKPTDFDTEQHFLEQVSKGATGKQSSTQ